MKPLSWIPSVLLVTVLLYGTGCASSRLEKSAFEGRTMAVTAAYPPPASVRHPLFTMAARGLPLGVYSQDHRKLKRLQTLLRTATEGFDLPARIAPQMVARAAPALGTRLVSDPKTADYVLDLRVYDYGLVVNGPVTGARFYLEAEARVHDRAQGEVIWKEHLSRILRDTEISLYGSRGYDLTSEDLKAVLEEFTAYAAERMQTALQKDIR